MSTQHLCPECRSRRAQARLLLAWAAVLAGIAGVLGALVTLLAVFVHY